jgi:LmbE family N-acetylglucosaminyl deacetylase
MGSMTYSSEDIKKLGAILGVWAHPDDEAWTSGGIMAAACQNGQRVVCVTATRGDAGKTADEEKWPQAQLGVIRERELDASLAALGSIDHRWLNYRDGELKAVDWHQPIGELEAIIREVQPDTILTFGPDGLTGHDDHKTVYAWVCEALHRAASRATVYMAIESAEKYDTCGKILHRVGNIYWATPEPVTVRNKDADLLFELSGDVYEKKIDSLKAHASQMTNLFLDPVGGRALHDYAKIECFCKA